MARVPPGIGTLCNMAFIGLWLDACTRWLPETHRLLPHAALLRLGPEQLAALFVHEIAHVRRGDYLVNLLQSIVELVLFFSPAVLWMSRRVREARPCRRGRRSRTCRYLR